MSTAHNDNFLTKPTIINELFDNHCVHIAYNLIANQRATQTVDYYCHLLLKHEILSTIAEMQSKPLTGIDHIPITDIKYCVSYYKICQIFVIVLWSVIYISGSSASVYKR